MKLDHLTATDVGTLIAGVNRLVDELNRFVLLAPELSVFADDAAAADGRVKVGEEYITPDGFRKRRMA